MIRKYQNHTQHLAKEPKNTKKSQDPNKLIKDWVNTQTVSCSNVVNNSLVGSIYKYLV